MDEIIGGVLGIIAIQTGRVLVWLVSFGKWRGEPLFGDEGRIYGAAGALSFVRDGRRVITDRRPALASCACPRTGSPSANTCHWP